MRLHTEYNNGLVGIKSWRMPIDRRRVAYTVYRLLFFYSFLFGDIRAAAAAGGGGRPYYIPSTRHEKRVEHVRSWAAAVLKAKHRNGFCYK